MLTVELLLQKGGIPGLGEVSVGEAIQVLGLNDLPNGWGTNNNNQRRSSLSSIVVIPLLAPLLQG